MNIAVNDGTLTSFYEASLMDKEEPCATYYPDHNVLSLPAYVELPEYHSVTRLDLDVQRSLTQALRLSLSFD